MISVLTGTIVHKDIRFFVIDVSGVGYKVSTTTANIASLKNEEKVTIWTHLAVREDALDLYGFKTKEELDFFALLITISGIGPKTALGVLNVASPSVIREAVFSGDTSYLTKVSGVGKKMSQKIVNELKDKFDAGEFEGESASLSKDADILEALKSLGYPERDAREAIKKISKDSEKASDRIKEALKILSSK